MSNKPGFSQSKMEKRWLIPIAVLFLGFVLFGLLTASRLDFPPAIKVLPQPPAETQNNYLLVQVNNLEERSPEVISIWVAFMNSSDTTHIVFMPLFPNSDLKINNKISRSLRVTRAGVVADRSVRKIERRYHIRMNGFVVVDNAALTALAGQLFDKPLTPADEAPHDAEGISRILADGKDHFSSFCTQIQQSGNGLILNRIDWGQILPAHLRTDLAFEELTLEIESILPTGQVQTCVVIEN